MGCDSKVFIRCDYSLVPSSQHLAPLIGKGSKGSESAFLAVSKDPHAVSK